MEITKLSAWTLTEDQFSQIVEIETNCGLEPYTPDMLYACIAEMSTLACLDGDRIAGFITYSYSRRYLGGSLYIVNLNVAKAYRRQGIARRLITSACSRAGWDMYVTLDVARNNTPARSLYAELGFEETALPSANGNTDIVMALSPEKALSLNGSRPK